MGMRTAAAVVTAKVLSKVCRAVGKQGVTMAGKYALKIDPDILKNLSKQVREKIFVVCGTNGKTTTNNLLCAAIESEGKKVVCNHTGSNMLSGVAAAFVLAAKANGTLDADYACIEIDEASTVRVFPHFQPDYMVLTNLFRDQLDRYGEIDITMDLLKRAAKMAPNMELIVNADDSLSVFLSEECGNQTVTFGISEKVFDESPSHEIREGRFCRRCGARLEYEFYHYSQLGVYHCPSCGFSRPAVDFEASHVRNGEMLEFTVEGRRFSAGYRGFYNIYNILAAYSAARTAGFSLKNFSRMLKEFTPQFGRNEIFTIGSSRVILNLAKNPAGFNQNISSVMEDREEKDLIIVINDNEQDGTDISWLWDVDFDRFADESVKSITVSGIRCQDMRLRLKYVDISADLVENVQEAIEKKLKDGIGNLYVLVNYTALYATHGILHKLAGQ